MTCIDEWKQSMFGTWYFVGWITTLLWLPSFGDKYGRRNLVWIGISILTVCNVGMLLARSVTVMSCIVFVMGMTSSIRTNIGYVYMMELIPKDWLTPINVIWCNVGATGYIFASIYFWKISKHAFYF